MKPIIYIVSAIALAMLATHNTTQEAFKKCLETQSHNICDKLREF